jgi:site-specific DNA-methyltransferase (adenine-specific)
MAGNALYYGDNLAVLRESIASESVDLVYLDPPFNSNASYNVLFQSPAGAGSQAQIEAFEDTWHWGQEAESAVDQVMRSGNTAAADLLRAMRSFLGESDMMAYLAMMTIRLIELHRVLKPTGSLYIHCDSTASHYLKLVMDSIFGAAGYLNEIIWKRTSAHSNATRKLGAVHDVILLYVKGAGFTWNQLYTPYSASYIAEHFVHLDPDGRRFRRTDLVNPGVRPNLRYDYLASNGRTYKPHSNGWKVSLPVMQALDRENRLFFPAKDDARLRKKIYLDESPGVPLTDVWDDLPPLHASSPERMGYPTQKPVTLLERIIASSSNPDDAVLDPFCGCGTTIHAAQRLGRRWLGIDVTHLAISLIERRLKDAFPGIAFEVHGTPQDLDGAADLALRDKYQFQWWAISLIDAQPFAGKKKGADGGIDGLIYFRSDAKTTERAVVSVKGGGVSVPMVRDLKGVLDREKAPIGVFLTLELPTRPMEREAASAGFYTLGDRQYPRIQIITIEQALAGKMPAIPLVDTGASFRRAPREVAAQPKLAL